MEIGAGLILFRSTAWKPMENVIATILEENYNRGMEILLRSLSVKNRSGCFQNSVYFDLQILAALANF